MKEGDIIEWRGVNKTIRGKVIKDEKGDFVCQLDNGCIFPLKDLRHSRSAKLFEVWHYLSE